MRYLRLLTDRILAKRGYELRAIGAAPKGYARFLADVGRFGVQPRTVFDIGVGSGTPWLYEAFPAAKLVLVEPQSGFRADIAGWQAKLNADYHPVALGAQASLAEMFVPDLAATSASLKMWSAETAGLIEQRGQASSGRVEAIRVQTLDDINEYEPPFLLKIDVEGSELDVLRGGQRTLAATHLVLLEASIMPRFQNEPNFLELASYLNRCGFDLFDLVELAQDTLGGRLRYVDAAFIRCGLIQ
jgi:FkbM family methyltransferase